MDSVIKKGAKSLSEFRKKYKTRDGWYGPDGFGTSNTEDGFTGNDVDWTQYFPDVSNEEIDRLIKDALDFEKKVRTATTAALVLVGVGISTAISGGSVGSLGLVKVIEIIGSYFSSEDGGGTATDAARDLID